MKKNKIVQGLLNLLIGAWLFIGSLWIWTKFLTTISNLSRSDAGFYSIVLFSLCLFLAISYGTVREGIKNLKEGFETKVVSCPNCSATLHVPTEFLKRERVYKCPECKLIVVPSRRIVYDPENGTVWRVTDE